MILIPYAALRAKGIPFSKVHLWRLERLGRFPKRVHISPHSVAWIESEIDSYINERIASRVAAVVAA